MTNTTKQTDCFKTFLKIHKNKRSKLKLVFTFKHEIRLKKITIHIRKLMKTSVSRCSLAWT